MNGALERNRDWASSEPINESDRMSDKEKSDVPEPVEEYGGTAKWEKCFRSPAELEETESSLPDKGTNWEVCLKNCEEKKMLQEEKPKTDWTACLGRAEQPQDTGESTEAHEPDMLTTASTPEELAQIKEMDERNEFKDNPIPEAGKEKLPPNDVKLNIPRNSGYFFEEEGNSPFVPKKEAALAKMKEYGRNSVEYRGGEPDFSPFTTHESPWGRLNCEVQIGHMTGERSNPSWEYGRRPRGGGHDPNMDLGNYAQAENSLLECIRETHPNVTAEELVTYRKANRLTWHECADGYTMQLIPTDIHAACPHTGGAALQKELQAWGNVELECD